MGVPNVTYQTGNIANHVWLSEIFFIYREFEYNILCTENRRTEFHLY